MQALYTEDEDGYMTTRMFIPSKVRDNKILLRNDPGYISRLREIGSPDPVRAHAGRHWSVITGAYFPEFSTDTRAASVQATRPLDAVPQYGL